MRHFIICCLSLLLSLTACQKQRLVVESRFLGRDTLASTWIHTPDPRQYCPTTGQELTISWRLPDEFAQHQQLNLLLTVRFGNREQATRVIPIHRFRGSYTYCLLNDDYWDKCGILTYKIELCSEGCCLDCWYHQLWTELICFDAYEEEEEVMDGPPWQL